MSGVSCYSSFFMFRDSCVLAFGWINVVWRKIPFSWRRTHHGRPNPFSRHGRPSSLLHRGSRNGRRPGGLLSCLHVPWGLQSAHPPSPLVVIQGGMCLLGGGGEDLMSELCPHVLCFPSSCAHIWSVSCSLLVLLISSQVPGVCHSLVYSSEPCVPCVWFQLVSCVLTFGWINVVWRKIPLSPCSRSPEKRDRTADHNRYLCTMSPRLFVPVFFFFFRVFLFFFHGDGSCRSLHCPWPPWSPIRPIFLGILQARTRWRHHSLAVLAQGQFPSSRGPPRHHRTKMEGRDPLVSGECPALSQNQPAVFQGSPHTTVCGAIQSTAVHSTPQPAARKPAAVRGPYKPAVARGHHKPDTVLSQCKPAAVHGSPKPTAESMSSLPAESMASPPTVRMASQPVAAHSSPVPALRKRYAVPAPPECPSVPAPRKRYAVPAPPECPPVPAPQKRYAVPVPPECPPVPAPCKHYAVPAPPECPLVPAPQKQFAVPFFGGVVGIQP